MPVPVAFVAAAAAPALASNPIGWVILGVGSTLLGASLIGAGVYYTLFGKKKVFSTDTCSICYRSWNENSAHMETLPCGHCFHIHCIHKWAFQCEELQNPCICPLCRAEFSHSKLSPDESSSSDVGSSDSEIESLKLK